MQKDPLLTARRAFSNLKDLQVIAVRTKNTNVLTRQLNYNLEDLGIEKVERFSMESLDSAIERTQLAFDKLYEPSMEGLVSKFFDLFSSKKIDTDSFTADQGIGKEYKEGKTITITVKPNKDLLLVKEGGNDPFTSYVNYYDASIGHMKVLKEANDFYVKARKDYFAILKKANEGSADNFVKELGDLNAQYEKQTFALVDKLESIESDLKNFISPTYTDTFSFNLPSEETYNKALSYASKAGNLISTWKFRGEYDYQMNEDDRYSFSALERNHNIILDVGDTVIDKLFSAAKDSPLIMVGVYGHLLDTFAKEIK